MNSDSDQLVLEAGQHLWGDGGSSDDICLLCGHNIQDYPEQCPEALEVTVEAVQHLWQDVPGCDDFCLLCCCDMQESEVPCDRGALPS